MIGHTPAAGDLAPRLRFDSVDAAMAHLKAQGVSYMLAQFVDIHGVAKAKSVPLAHLTSVMTDGAGFAGFAIWGVGIEPHGPRAPRRHELDPRGRAAWRLPKVMTVRPRKWHARCISKTNVFLPTHTASFNPEDPPT